MNSLCECLRGLGKIPHLIQDKPWFWADVIKSVPQDKLLDTVVIFHPQTVGFGEDIIHGKRDFTNSKWENRGVVGLIALSWKSSTQKIPFRIACIPMEITSPDIISSFLRVKSKCILCNKLTWTKLVRINQETGEAKCNICRKTQRQFYQKRHFTKHKGGPRTQATAPTLPVATIIRDAETVLPAAPAIRYDNNDYYQDHSDDSFGNYDPYDDDCPDRHQPDWDIINEHYSNID